MADKILMNKNTLAALKGELREYSTALPVFEMKEQQLKEVVQAIENSVLRLKRAIAVTNVEVQEWVAVMAEETIDFDDLIKVARITTELREIAGVTIEEFENIEFEDSDVDLLATPLWVDTALEVIKDQKTNYLLVKMEEKTYSFYWRNCQRPDV